MIEGTPVYRWKCETCRMASRHLMDADFAWNTAERHADEQAHRVTLYRDMTDIVVKVFGKAKAPATTGAQATLSTHPEEAK